MWPLSPLPYLAKQLGMAPRNLRSALQQSTASMRHLSTFVIQRFIHKVLHAAQETFQQNLKCCCASWVGFAKAQGHSFVLSCRVLVFACALIKPLIKPLPQQALCHKGMGSTSKTKFVCAWTDMNKTKTENERGLTSMRRQLPIVDPQLLL